MTEDQKTAQTTTYWTFYETIKRYAAMNKSCELEVEEVLVKLRADGA
jgi:hypothetical protein